MSHPLERETAEMVSARLTRGQIIDLVYIHRHGRMEVGRRKDGKTRSPVQRLIDARILAMGATRGYVFPGPHFDAIMDALLRAGMIHTLDKLDA